MEVPDEVLTAIKHVVAWAHSCDSPDEIIIHDLPAFENWLTTLELKELGEITVWMVKSAVDDGLHGPFLTRDDALAFAENADGSIFECRARLTSAEEI
jgi:hypothetical protein